MWHIDTTGIPYGPSFARFWSIPVPEAEFACLQTADVGFSNLYSTKPTPTAYNTSHNYFNSHCPILCPLRIVVVGKSCLIFNIKFGTDIAVDQCSAKTETDRKKEEELDCKISYSPKHKSHKPHRHYLLVHRKSHMPNQVK